ncbi:unnamed protein product [Cyprideis torosa]|uniref:Uncharacterized protein n=1 Tax=Cyprideis torosa TaxID=163714 RepID=A0A7R8WQF2_9CRUS|nr:unnamed protein product [Cyprideis torosa]CAG0902927.1 unnamed protein product [Cyprideis torosa]
MIPEMVDMTGDECRRYLRSLELTAFGSLVSALRAQGAYTAERADLLERISVALFIPDERKRAEFRRVAYDEKLNTVAVKVFGIRSCDSWALEGRRLVPIPPRANPETIFTGLANAAANKMVLLNAKLPPIEESRTSKIPLPRHLPTDFSCFDDALAILDRRYEEVSEDVLEAARLLVPGYDPELDGVDEVKTEPNQASEEEKNSISEKVAEPESVVPPEPEPSLPPGNEAFEAFLRDHNESPSSRRTKREETMTMMVQPPLWRQAYLFLSFTWVTRHAPPPPPLTRSPGSPPPLKILDPPL